MFGTFFHPRPVGRRREVAELSVRMEARTPIAPHAVVRVSPDGSSASGSHLVGVTPNAPIEFSVSYSLAEYLSIVRDHLPRVVVEQRRSRGKPPKAPSALDRLLVVPFASVAFAIKKRRMPVCDFSISEVGIRRTTAGRTLQIPWSEVVAVHRYSQGYLVTMKQGALPLPYRCFDAESRTAFESWAARVPPRTE